MIEISYALYLFASLAMTVWVARTLSFNGEVFLIDCFGHDAVLARSTNHLLVVGFYLVNIGFILLTLQFGTEPASVPQAIRFVATKVGLGTFCMSSYQRPSVPMNSCIRPIRWRMWTGTCGRFSSFAARSASSATVGSISRFLRSVAMRVSISHRSVSATK